MCRLSQPKAGMFQLYQPMFRLARQLFWLSWFMFWLSAPKSGMFRLLCSACFRFFNRIWEWFDFMDLCLTFLTQFFLFCGSKLCMFLFLCSTYNSTFSTKIGYISTLSTYVSTFLTSVLSFLTYYLTFWTKIGYILILYSTYVSFFSTKIGHVSNLSTSVLTFWLKFWLSWPKSVMFGLLCSTYCSNLTEIGYVLFLSTYVLSFLTYDLTFWTKIGYILILYST